MKQKKYILLILLAGFLIRCGGSATGGSEFGNPSRTLKGVVASEANPSGSLARKATSAHDDCPADTVVLTNSLLTTVSLDVNSDCSFDDSVSIDQGYEVSFYKDDIFVANLEATNGPDVLPTSVIYVSDGSTDIDLGTIIISGTRAIPENEPSHQNDRDDDGINDFDDDDDDEDGVGDDDETDCDLDGFSDDDDEDSSCEESESGGEGEASSLNTVLEVSPRNNSVAVDLDKEIEIRFGCDLKSASVTSSTLSISSGSDTVLCDFEVDGDEVQCKHETDLFLPNRTYTAVLDGIRCFDNTVISTITWSWTTSVDD